MAYERYVEVRLPHGCVVDEELWQRVQNKIKELDGTRSKGRKHCYPLSGLLLFNDGSSFEVAVLGEEMLPNPPTTTTEPTRLG